MPFFPIVFVRLFMWNYLYYLNFWKSNHKFICTFMLSCIYIILWQYLIKGFWITKKKYIYNKQQISDILSCVILRMNTVKLILYNFWFGNRLYGCFRWLLVHVHVLPTRYQILVPLGYFTIKDFRTLLNILIRIEYWEFVKTMNFRYCIVFNNFNILLFLEIRKEARF